MIRSTGYVENASGDHAEKSGVSVAHATRRRLLSGQRPPSAIRFSRLLTSCTLLITVVVVEGIKIRADIKESEESWSWEKDEPPVDILNCSALADDVFCEARNGCSWCEGVGTTWDNEKVLWAGNETRCRPWQHCEGPAFLCEMRRNQSACLEADFYGNNSLLRHEIDEGDKPKAPRKDLCVWCPSETRCVAQSLKGKSAGQDVEDRGQCVGCDGVFDSGEELDMCRVCGGGCVATDLRIENPDCDCLGCDLVPFSGNAMDVCGVCGGKNETCSLFPVTLEEKVGVVLALCGNILISVSLNIQKYTHTLNQAASGGEVAYTDIPLWWTGMAIMVVGETGNFLAYAYAPATLVAPLGAVTVVSNCIIAHYVLKETIRKRNMAGVVLAIIGAVFIMVYAPDSQKQLTMELLELYMLQPSFIVFIICILLAITGLFLLDDHYKKKYVVFYILICSLCGSLTVMCVKGVSTALVLTITGQGHPFGHVIPWIMLITLLGSTVVQIRILNLAMIHFGSSEVVPVYYVLFTLCSVLGGMVLYKEYHQNCAGGVRYCHNTIGFVFGIIITFTGVFLITFGEKDDARSDKASFRSSDRSYHSESISGDELAAAEREGLLISHDLESFEKSIQFEMHGAATGGVMGGASLMKATAKGAGPRFLSSEL